MCDFNSPVSIPIFSSLPSLFLYKGNIRAAACRRLCRFFTVELTEDPEDMTRKILEVQLVGPKKGFLTEYADVKAPEPVDADLRPVGIPQVQ